MVKRDLDRKSFIWLVCHYCSPLREVLTGTQAEMETLEEHCLLAYSSMACSICSFIQLRTPAQGYHHSQ